MLKSPDVIVIGAGAAGMAAANELGRAGLSVTIFEGRNRIGGRMFTHHDPDCEVPIELGAEFVHGLPPEIWKPLTARGVRITEVTGEAWCGRKGHLSGCDFFSQVDDILGQMKLRSPDESFQSFVDRHCKKANCDPDARQRALDYVTGFNAADPDRVGVRWLVREMRADEKIQGNRSFRPQNGYESLVGIFRRELSQASVDIQTEAIVNSVTWKRGHAEVVAHRGRHVLRLTSGRALVTLPLALLQAAGKKAQRNQTGVVRFIPSLPGPKMEALKKLEMGKVIRVTLRFRERFWDTIAGSARKDKTLTKMSFLFSEDDWFPTWWTTMPDKSPIITGWAPFQCAERLSGKSRSFVIEHSLRTLGKLLGIESGRLTELLEAAYFHDWQSDPFSRGAYSYGGIGADGAQEALGSPVANTLFFAGEATDTSGHNGTVHGAIASGHRAAREILQTFGRVRAR